MIRILDDSWETFETLSLDGYSIKGRPILFFTDLLERKSLAWLKPRRSYPSDLYLSYLSISGSKLQRGATRFRIKERKKIYKLMKPCINELCKLLNKISVHFRTVGIDLLQNRETTYMYYNAILYRERNVPHSELLRNSTTLWNHAIHLWILPNATLPRPYINLLIFTSKRYQRWNGGTG